MIVDNEIGETWDGIKERIKKEIEEKYTEDMKILEYSDLEFTIHNNGLHVIVYGKNHTIDYWPTKDKWISRTDKKKRFGIHKLISYAKCDV